jgi:hypothetical protein
MKMRLCTALLACAILPAAVAAQQMAAPAASANPVADAFRGMAKRNATVLIGAAEAMPAEKYSYRPTPAQMSFAQVQTHLAEGNDLFCGKIGGVAAPKRTPVDSTASKDVLLARLKETFAFCDEALAKLDDSKLGETMQVFGPNPYSRAMVILITMGDWQDHYSQEAIYLRLNGLLPPTARRGSM